MNITDKAMKNHEKLFPEIGVTDTLDEDLIEILLNFNFDEASVVMECKVDDIYETDTFENFILKIENTYA